MCTYIVVNPAEYIPQVRELMAANWAETGFAFEFDPSVQMYQAMFERGLMFAIAALDEGHVVGYCSVLVTPHPHNPAVKMASNDALYVHPDYRKSLVSGRLILKAEAQAQARGAAMFSWHCRAGTELAAMFERHGYKPADVVVTKELDHGC